MKIARSLIVFFAANEKAKQSGAIRKNGTANGGKKIKIGSHHQLLS